MPGLPTSNAVCNTVCNTVSPSTSHAVLRRSTNGSDCPNAVPGAQRHAHDPRTSQVCAPDRQRCTHGMPPQVSDLTATRACLSVDLVLGPSCPDDSTAKPHSACPAAHGHWCAFTDLYHTIPYHTIPYRAARRFTQFESGHYGLRTGNNANLVTILRHPFDRLVSGFLHDFHDCTSVAAMASWRA